MYFDELPWLSPQTADISGSNGSHRDHLNRYSGLQEFSQRSLYTGNNINDFFPELSVADWHELESVDPSGTFVTAADATDNIAALELGLSDSDTGTLPSLEVSPNLRESELLFTVDLADSV